MPLGFAAPIVKVSPQDANRLVLQLKADVLAYEGVSEDTMYDGESRVYETIEICNDIAKLASEKGINYDYYAYMVQTRAVAMMALDAFPELDSGSLWIECLVTHPGTSEGGMTLLEFAVQLSQTAGLNGRIKLGAAYESAQGFYRLLGFKATGKTLTEDLDEGGQYEYPEMELNPSARVDIWGKTGSRKHRTWSLRRFAVRPKYYQ